MRKLVFAFVAAGCLALAVGYVGWAALSQDSGAASEVTPPAARPAVAALGGKRAYVVFQHAGRDDDYARIAVAPVAAPDRYTIAGRMCERVYFAAGRALCLMPVRGIGFKYSAMILGGGLAQRSSLEFPGIISRARVSPDGRYGAVTGFVTGHSYRDKGFSTNTVLIDMARGSVISDLEKFTVTRDGETIASPDFNFWGVTFARDSDRFYATLETRGKRYLVEGSVRERRMHTLHENVECPSLSPDGMRVAYKKRLGPRWRLTVLDLATMRETPLAEMHSVDDQAEWLDDDHVLYALGPVRPDGRVGYDVWEVPADGSGHPKVFLKDARSPAVAHAHAESLSS